MVHGLQHISYVILKIIGFNEQECCFNETSMYHDSLSIYVTDVFDDGQHRVSVQVEHVEENKNNTAKIGDVVLESRFDDNGNHVVSPSTPISNKRSVYYS
jgi:hypothetical protein